MSSEGNGRPEGARDPAAGRAVDFGLLRRVWSYIRPHQGWIWLGLLLLVASSACRLTLPYLVKIGIDEHMTPRVSEGLAALLAGFFAIALAEVVLRRWQLLAVEHAGQNALYDLRQAIFRHMQGLPARYFDRTPTGRLVGRVTTDVEALQELFSSGVVTILGDFLLLITTFVILVTLNWQLTLVTLLVVPVLLAMTLVIRSRVRTAYVDLRARLSQMNAFLHEHLSGMPVVQMFLQEDRTRGKYREINDGVRHSQLRTVRWESTLSAGVEMVGSFTAALILWYGGGLVIEDMEGGVVGGMTLGALFAFLDYMQKFFGPLNDLSMKYTVMQNATTASRRIFELLDVDERIPEPAEPHIAERTDGEIVFDRVTFGYDPDEPVIRDLSFHVKPGERIAVVGATGSGKTTLLKLLTRMYDLQHGRILLDGVDIREYPQRELRRRIGLVAQDVFLFEGDILENIRLGKPEIQDDDAIAAASRLHLDEVVNRFPGGYREPVRERGKNLSSGEKQLLSFARVLAAAPCVLALDEATSNVDSHTEHLLQEAVHEIMEGRSSLVVAHRLSTIRDVDRILVLHKGKLVEEGNHDQLMARRGTYWRLVQLQYADAA